MMTLFYEVSDDAQVVLDKLFGPFILWNTLLSVFVAFLPTVVYSMRQKGCHKVTFYLIFWYGIVTYISQYSTFPSTALIHDMNESTTIANREFLYPNNVMGFSLFSNIPMIFLLGFYFGIIYRSNDKNVQKFVYEYPVALSCFQQLFRVSGGFLWYLYFHHSYPNLDSWFAFQTGLLDILVGTTAIPIGLYYHFSCVQEEGQGDSRVVRNVLYYWHVVGLATIVCALTTVMTNYFNIYNFGICQHTLIYLTFPPMPLVMYYQVPYAIMTHVLYITNIDTILNSQTSENDNSFLGLGLGGSSSSIGYGGGSGGDRNKLE